jgi:hypothetical protein
MLSTGTWEASRRHTSLSEGKRLVRCRCRQYRRSDRLDGMWYRARMIFISIPTFLLWAWRKGPCEIQIPRNSERMFYPPQARENY